MAVRSSCLLPTIRSDATCTMNHMMVHSYDISIQICTRQSRDVGCTDCQWISLAAEASQHSEYDLQESRSHSSSSIAQVHGQTQQLHEQCCRAARTGTVSERQIAKIILICFAQ